MENEKPYRSVGLASGPRARIVSFSSIEDALEQIEAILRSDDSGTIRFEARDCDCEDILGASGGQPGHDTYCPVAGNPLMLMAEAGGE